MTKIQELLALADALYALPDDGQVFAHLNVIYKAAAALREFAEMLDQGQRNDQDPRTARAG